MTLLDAKHDNDEVRFVLMGMTERRRLVVVFHVERGETIRILSARLANRRERMLYEEGEGDHS